MTESQETGGALAGRTAWARSLRTPLREFLRTETGSAAVLVSATVIALVWANVDSSSYVSLWRTHLSVMIGGHGVSLDLREWINSGLMTFFFFVIGLEARREFDMGELRDRRRVALPLIAGIGGMLVPIAIYLIVNQGRASAHGWGTAMSTDTAFALGMLALAGSHLPERLRTYLLTVTVVDDLVALVVITVFYGAHVEVRPLLVGIALFGVVLLLLASHRVRQGVVYFALAVAIWVALLKAGIEPVVTGLGLGLLTYASPASRGDLERATDLFRLFREQPTPELARTATAGLAEAISPNERLQQLYHSWTSYVIVPLFALSNAGITISGSFLSSAITSPITLGIVIAYVIGKPVGIIGSSWLVTKVSGGRVRPPVGWAAVAGGGTIAGIGFTVSLLIASLAFTGRSLEQAKFGILCAALLSAAVTWLVFRIAAALPTRLRLQALLGTADELIDLAAPVDPGRDHIRGPAEALVTLVEYGDLECPFCGQAEPVIRELLSDFGDLRYVWRHLPLNDVHPFAQIAAEASEAAAAQGAFWEMHDLLLERQDDLRPAALIRYADELGLDVDRFHKEIRNHTHASRIAEDVDSADLSGVSGTPTFFVNGRRHQGAYDIESLSAAVHAAKARVLLSR